MEEMHRAGCGERAWSFHAPSRLTTLPASSFWVFFNPEALRTPSLWVVFFFLI